MFWLLYFDVFENACVCTWEESFILNLRCRSGSHGIANCAKTPNELPQKHQTKHRKTPNKMPQKHQTPCRIHKEPVSLQHHYIANNMEYLKRTANEHLSLLREPDLLMVIKGGEMAYTRPDGVKIIPLACLKD